jgi:hypothetical protein
MDKNTDIHYIYIMYMFTKFSFSINKIENPPLLHSSTSKIKSL